MHIPDVARQQARGLAVKGDNVVKRFHTRSSNDFATNTTGVCLAFF
jgi:hypothetical protein